MEKKTNAVVLYPSPPIGHLVAMVELGKLLLLTQPSLSLHILLATPPYNAGDTAPYIRRVSAASAAGDGPPITFHHLPTISAPLNPTSSVHHETQVFELLSLNNPNVRQILTSLSRNHHLSIRALITDFFCATAHSVASDLGIPGYFLVTSGVEVAAYLLHVPHLHRTTAKSFKDLNTSLQIPGLPPIPFSDLPKPQQDRSDKAYDWFLTSSNHLLRSAGIIINTFDALEPRPLKALTAGLCVPDAPTPPIFCIGPMITAEGRREGGGARGGECLEWLDSQPSRSVVFLCFGSLGMFSAEQLREIAAGLERSGKRFLWVVRSPREAADHSLRTSASPEPDLESLLPRGFLERTRERGLVVKSWAPQVAVLSHGSVGGFVTHCGWNSVLEAVCAGVPMVAWPLYAEQRFNRVVLVEEMKLALPMTESEGGFVGAAEVGRRVSELMDSEEGGSVRERVLEMREGAKAAMRDEGGSSRLALSRLIDSLRLN